MEIIHDNIPNPQETIKLIITSVLLKESSTIIYNKDQYPNSLLVNHNILEYNNIYKDLYPNTSEFFQNILINEIKSKSDLCLLILTNSTNHANIYLNSLKDLFTKNFFILNKINSVEYNYYKLSTSSKIYDNQNDFKKLDLNSSKFKLNIPEITKKNLFVKLEIKDKNFCKLTMKILFIHKKYEKLCYYFCLNHEIFENILLTEKIKKLLTMESSIKSKINNLPLIQENFIENLNEYKNEVIKYYSELVDKIDKLKLDKIDKNDLDI